MIDWNSGPNLWPRFYAGVTMMVVITSSLPDATDPQLVDGIKQEADARELRDLRDRQAYEEF